MNTELPIYKALISDENDGIFVMSLVDMPATEVNWVCFNKDERKKFSIADDDEHIISGVVMTADTPIYRISPNGTEYYIMFTKDVIKEMSEKMLSDKTFNNIDIQHNGKLLDEGSVKLIELFIKDSAKGINPNYIDVPEGSLMANYKIYDDNLWNEIKDGTLNGLSLEGVFSQVRLVEPVNRDTKLEYIYKMMNKVKETLRSLLAEMPQDDENTAENFEVVEEVKTEDKVEETEIKEENVTNELDKLKSLIDEHSDLLNELVNRLETLEGLVKTINETPAAEPIEEEFTKKSSKKFVNKAAEMASYLK